VILRWTWSVLWSITETLASRRSATQTSPSPAATAAGVPPTWTTLVT
jgi:hypothetical protein